MASFNKVILMGNLTRDPEHRVTSGGLSICKLGLAVNRKYTKQDGTKVEETTFVDIDSFGKQAELISQYMKRGDPIMLEGRLRFDTWESNTGEKRSKLNVVLENFQFLSRGGDAEGSQGGGASRRYEETSPPARSAPAPAPQKEAPAAQDDSLEDDVPF